MSTYKMQNCLVALSLLYSCSPLKLQVTAVTLNCHVACQVWCKHYILKPIFSTHRFCPGGWLFMTAFYGQTTLKAFSTFFTLHPCNFYVLT